MYMKAFCEVNAQNGADINLIRMFCQTVDAYWSQK